MHLKELGYSTKRQQYWTEQNLEQFVPGRVIAQHRDRYTIATAQGEYSAEITGNMRFTAESTEDFPAVGDWVAAVLYDPEMAVIHRTLPRSSCITRKTPGHLGGTQVIAANIDYGLIVQAVDRDFNINRMERYLTICNASHVEPVIVLSKTDLIDAGRLREIVDRVHLRISDIPVIPVSSVTGNGYTAINAHMEAGKTYCLLGSSGVGKSTLLNSLSGKAVMKTGAISTSTAKGKHVTSHRELTCLRNGAIIIDNPGMREVGISDTSGGLEKTFSRIEELAGACRFSDCTHTSEAGCAVLDAVDSGMIDHASYENYLKMRKERAHYQATSAERRKKDKQLAKVVKHYKQFKKNNRQI